ncbi:MAG: hypothetical protein HKL83_00715 [Acidimicrobiaceae bacterium]|nr:hypothetical protein [Acidimicrobiaceae bacterium]
MSPPDVDPPSDPPLDVVLAEPEPIAVVVVEPPPSVDFEVVHPCDESVPVWVVKHVVVPLPSGVSVLGGEATTGVGRLVV